jgi:GT2 family glycosyltransferase
MHHAKGGFGPFLLSLCTPRLRDDALLSQGIAAYKEGRHAEALIAAEYLCRRLGTHSAPAILRARVLQDGHPALAADAWQHAWQTESDNTALQDAMLDAWQAAGHNGKIAELGPQFLTARCRQRQHGPLLQRLRQAGLNWLAAAWKRDNAIEAMVFAPPAGPATASLLLACEDAEYRYEVPADGTPFLIMPPREHAVWSLSLAVDEDAPKLVVGSPLAFYPAPQAPAVAVLPTPSPRPVSIVIPVYREQALVQACLDSVLASLRLNRTAAEIVVIDDASPEPALSAWLDEQAQRGTIRLLRNRCNLGFIEATNRGMRELAGHDVLLLNADTQVHGNWIDRLRAALYQAPDIASVTPWSNNGEISSFPQIARAAVAPSMQQLAVLDNQAAALRAAGKTEDVELPSCCGFTMLIRRDVLDRIGMLDGNALVRGYGEEVDWCQRARAAGLRHLQATGVFVAHTGTVSFKLEKQLRVRENRKVVHARYPEFYAEYQRFLLQDPLKTARAALAKAVARALPSGTDHGTALPHDVPALSSPVRRIAVWQHRVSHNDNIALLKLARRLASDGGHTRLLLIGEASEALWHTGVADVLPSANGDDRLLLSDEAMLRLAGCSAVLHSQGTAVPDGLPACALGSPQLDAWLTQLLEEPFTA